jgi:ankyrin repeat protein
VINRALLFCLLLFIPHSLSACYKQPAVDKYDMLFHTLVIRDLQTLQQIIPDYTSEELSAPFINGQTALAIAVESNWLESISILLKNGADPCVRSGMVFYRTDNDRPILMNQKTPLNLAAHNGLVDAMELLLEHESASCYTASIRSNVIDSVNSYEDIPEREAMTRILKNAGFVN